MKSNRVLVTGANGYIGRGIVKQLLDDGMEVIAASRDIESLDKRATCIAGDIFEAEDPYEFYGKPDIVLHLAWRGVYNHNSVDHINDLPLHYRFLTQMIQSGLKHLCILGSMHEIGFFEGCIKEDTPMNPETLYGITKATIYEAMKLYCQQNNVIFQWIRGFYTVGNTTHGQSIFPKIMQAAERGDKIFPFTQGTNQYDFVDYNDFCEMVAAVVEQQKITGIINCCSGQPVPLKVRVNQFIEDNHLNIKLDYGAFPDRPYDSKAIWGDNQRISQILAERHHEKIS